MNDSPTRWRNVLLPSVLASAGAEVGSSCLFGEQLVAAGATQAAQADHGWREELRAQHKEAIKALDQLEEERDLAVAAADRWHARLAETEAQHSALQRQLRELEMQRHTAGHKHTEIGSVPAQRQLLSEKQQAIENLVQANKALDKALGEVGDENDSLQREIEQLRVTKRSLEEEIGAVHALLSRAEEELQGVEAEARALAEDEWRARRAGRAQVQALEEKLEQGKRRNVECLRKIQHNEVEGNHAMQQLWKLNRLVGELMLQRRELQAKIESRGENRDERSCRREELEDGILTLRQSLQSVAEQNLQMQELGKKASEFSELDDKVYALMDQLRRSEHQRGRQEQKREQKLATIDELESESEVLQHDLQSVLDERLEAESEARAAADMLAVLKGKHDRLHAAQQLALSLRDRAESRLRERRAKANALEINIEHSKTRIDGHEEDKTAMKYELLRVSDEMRKATVQNEDLSQRICQRLQEERQVQAERVAIKAEIEFIRREDMLDETGRTLPILIESESELIERLEINEFLCSAQQARNPVPLLIGKIAHILELLQQAHTTDCRLSEYVKDAAERVIKLQRRKRSTLARLNSCDAWKTTAMLNIVSNEFERCQTLASTSEAREHHILYLDGFQLRAQQLQRLPAAIRNHAKQDTVREIRLQDNWLDASSLPSLCELLDLCPHLCHLDLRRNRLDQHSVDKLAAFAQQALSASSSGLTIDLEDQGFADVDVDEDAMSDASDSELERDGDSSDASLSSPCGAELRLPEPAEPSAQKLPSLLATQCLDASAACSGARSPSMASDSTSAGTALSHARDSCSSDFFSSSRSPSLSSSSPTSLLSPSFGSSNSPSRHASRASRSPLAMPAPEASHGLSPTSSWRRQTSTGKLLSLPSPSCSTPSLPSPAPSSPRSSRRQGGFDWGKLAEDTAKLLGEQRSQVTLPRIAPLASSSAGAVDGDIEM